MTVKQARTGSISLIQLVISIVVVLSGAVGLYVKSSVTISQLNDRVSELERMAVQQHNDVLIKTASRDAQYQALDDRIDKNSDDINIIKTQMQYIRFNQK